MVTRCKAELAKDMLDGVDLAKRSMAKDKQIIGKEEVGQQRATPIQPDGTPFLGMH